MSPHHRPTINRVNNGSTLHLPRILCLHGGGTNAKIFSAQCRGLQSRLRNQFRLCFANAPFPSQAGPDVLSVYEKNGPFRRWFLGSPDDQYGETKTTLLAVEESLMAAMYDDDCEGATGNWVGLLGFSQGAKLASSLLLGQQTQPEVFGGNAVLPRFQFAVLMAGRAPLCMNPSVYKGSRAASSGPAGSTLIDTPTVHVHGLRDAGIELHRCWIKNYCKEGSARVVEWDGGHRVPITTKDVFLLVDAVIQLGRETGILM